MSCVLLNKFLFHEWTDLVPLSCDSKIFSFFNSLCSSGALCFFSFFLFLMVCVHQVRCASFLFYFYDVEKRFLF